MNPSFNNHHYNKAPDNSWSTTIANKENKTSDIYSFSLNCLIKKNKSIKHERLVLTYLCSLVLANSYAPEPNPGPPTYPCGACNKADTWKHKAICCDDCEQWYDINYQGIDHYMYEILNNSNLSWECAKCGMPNFSTTFFNSTIETSNSFLALDDEECIQDYIG